MEITPPILGAGGYGIVYRSGRNAVKLFYDLDCARAIEKEAAIQKRAREILDGILFVPEIYSVQAQPVAIEGRHYLCGIEMERIPILEKFGEPLHTLLGYHGEDINISWGKTTALPVGPGNPSRGFFAGPDLLEKILEDESCLHKAETQVSDGITLECVAYTMGRALRGLLDGGILPIDLEFIYGGGGRLYLIDFGLCEFGRADPEEFLERQGSSGLRGDIYVPHEGDRGYREFLEGFLRTA